MVIFLLVFQLLRILLEIYDTSMIGTTDFLRKFHRFHYFLLPHSLVTGIGSIESVCCEKNVYRITKLFNCKEWKNIDFRST